jgi:hypothetical protein
MIEQLKAGGFSVKIGDAVVGIAKTSTLSIDREPKLEMDWSPSPIKLTGTAKIDGNDSLLEDFLSGMKFEVETTICEKMNLPRKTKKACTSYYRRNTKWKRELNKWLMRSRHRLVPGEMVMTKDEAGRIEVVINSGRNEATSVSVDSDTILKALQEKQKVKL